VVGALALRMAGLFMPAARESVEMLYEFTEPLEVDSSKIQRTFGLVPTPIDEGMRQTVGWWQTRS